MRILKTGRFVRTARALAPAVLLTIGLVGTMAVPARAQFFNWGGDGGNGWGNSGWGNGGWGGDGAGWGNDTLRPGQIYRAIGERGFRLIAPMRRNGSVFVADVIDRRGRRERLIVAAADGQILQRFLLTDQRLPRSAGVEPDDLEQQMDRVERSEAAPPIPPASIPNAGNPGRIYGNGEDTPAVEALRPRVPQKAPRSPKPRLVERTPEMIQPDRDPAESQPTRLKARPSEPLRLPIVPGPTANKPIAPPSVTASRPVEPVAKPSAPTPTPASAVTTASAPPVTQDSAPPTTRMLRDPLAIPRSEPRPADASTASAATSPQRIVPGTVTGAPARDPAPSQKPAPGPAKSGDVPVAPLD